MHTGLLATLASISNDELILRLKRIAAIEARVTASFIAHLSEMDHRRLYLSEGCSSLFSYCTDVLHLSAPAAYNRIEVARAIRLYPPLLHALYRGAIHLSNARLLAPHLTPTNHLSLISRASFRPKRDVEELIVGLRQLPSVPATIRKLPPPRLPELPKEVETVSLEGSSPVAGPTISESSAVSGAQPDIPNLETDQGSEVVSHLLPARAPLQIAPLAPDRYRITFTADGEFKERLLQAQDLLRHRIPAGDHAAIFGLALKALVEQISRSRLGVGKRARSKKEHGSRHVPLEVKRMVWVRDGGQCRFLATNGRRCGARAFLEFHHVKPFATGGEATPENIELRCRAHNQYEAELVFGNKNRS